MLSNEFKEAYLCVCSVMPDSLDPMDCSPPGSSVLGISQARMLEWVAISCTRGLVGAQGLLVDENVYWLYRTVARICSQFRILSISQINTAPKPQPRASCHLKINSKPHYHTLITVSPLLCSF